MSESRCSSPISNPLNSALSFVQQAPNKCTGRRISIFFKGDTGTVKKTIGFVKKNWKVIAATALAWAVIIGLAGGLYGFEAVALKLVIGGGVGAGLGITTGLIRAMVIRPNHKHKNYSSAWGALNTLYGKLDENGTKEFLVALVTTSMLAVAVIYPYAAGGIIAALIFDHVLNQISFHNPVENLRTRLDAWNQKRIELQRQTLSLNNLEEAKLGEQFAGNKEDIARQIRELKEELDAIANDVNKLTQHKLASSSLTPPPSIDTDKVYFDTLVQYLGTVYQRYTNIKEKLEEIESERTTKTKTGTSITEYESDEED